MFDAIVMGFRDGGIFMYVILVISMFALAIAVERIYYIGLKYNIDGNAFMSKISKLIKDGRIAEAIKLCKGTSSILPRIILTALENAGKEEIHIQNAVDLTTIEVVPQLEKRTHYLAMLANISTLSGLLGTIQGLIQAFAAVGSADPSQKAELLAKGIAMAMYTTFYGLVVAIPVLVAYSYIQSKTKKILDDIDLYSVMSINLLTEETSNKKG